MHYSNSRPKAVGACWQQTAASRLTSCATRLTDDPSHLSRPGPPAKLTTQHSGRSFLRAGTSKKYLPCSTKVSRRRSTTSSPDPASLPTCRASSGSRPNNTGATVPGTWEAERKIGVIDLPVNSRSDGGEVQVGGRWAAPLLRRHGRRPSPTCRGGRERKYDGDYVAVAPGRPIRWRCTTVTDR